MKDNNNIIKTGFISRLFGQFRYWTSDWGGKLTFFFILLTLGYSLYLYFQWGGSEYVEAVNDILLVIIYFGAFLILLRTSRHSELSTRTQCAWMMIAFAHLCGTIGNTLWGYFEVITETQPFPSWADPFYLLYYPFMLWGFLLLAPKFETWRERIRLTLDAGIVTIGGGMLLWYFILEPIAQAGSEDRLLTALSLAYPVGDLVLFFGIAVSLLRKTSSVNLGALNYLLIGTFLIFFADLLFGYQNLNGTYQSGTMADSLYGLGTLAALISGHYQYVKTEQDANQTETLFEKKVGSFSWLPYLAIAAGFGILLKFAFERLEAVLSQLIIIATCLALFVVSRQILSMRETEKVNIALGELQERFQGIYKASKDAIAFTSFDGTLIDVNDAYLSLTGYTREELLQGTTYYQLTPPEYHQADSERVKTIIEFNQSAEYEKEFIRKDGSRVAVAVTAFPVNGNDGNPIGLAGIIRDITERKSFENQLTHQALHDPLTKLANRVLFSNRVEHALERVSRHQNPIAVMFLDLDNFKTINDSLGHAAGDELLVSVSERLQACLRTSDTAARLGGDEFAVLIVDTTHTESAVLIAERIKDVFREPFVIDGKKTFITTSIGIAVTVTGNENPDELLRNADVAMYTAKNQGKDRYAVFENEMHEVLIKRVELETTLRRAVENEEFMLHYQPIIDLQSESIMGMEALVRWNHPQRGLISPAEFIPVAEETNLIVTLGAWILEEACRQTYLWQTQHDYQSRLSITVNISSRQFQHPTLVEMVAATLLKTGLPAQSLILEITEGTMLQNTETTIKKLQDLKTLGIRLAIDDFGTGYSSLSYLQRFPIDILKIDKSFIDKISHSREGAAVARAIITMSDTLHLRTIAEGVETSEQTIELQHLGCELGQGFHFAKPLDKDDMNSYLKKEHLIRKRDKKVNRIKQKEINLVENIY